MWSRLIRRRVNSGFERQNLQTLATRQTIALREHDALEPTRERRRFAKLRELLPGHDECFLRRVLRQVDVAQHGKRAAEGHVLKANYEFAKRFASRRWRTTRIRRPADNTLDVFHF